MSPLVEDCLDELQRWDEQQGSFVGKTVILLCESWYPRSGNLL